MSATYRLIQKRARYPKPDKIIKKWKIVLGDSVFIRSGKSAGEKGKVIRVLRKRNLVVVEGVNMAKKIMRRTQHHPGGVFMKEQPVHYSNVALIDPADGLPCRIRYEFKEDGRKVRVSKRSGQEIPKPTENFKPSRRPPGIYDTAPEEVLRQTYFEEEEEDIPMKVYARRGPLEMEDSLQRLEEKGTHVPKALSSLPHRE